MKVQPIIHGVNARSVIPLRGLAIALSLSVAPSAGLLAQQTPAVADTGIRNTLPSRPMMSPRSASGMSGMKGMSGMSSMSGMSGMSDPKGVSAMGAMPTRHGEEVEIADLQSRLNATLALHARMMADTVVRQRVLQDPEMRRLAESASMPMPAMSAQAPEEGTSENAHGGMTGAKQGVAAPHAHEAAPTSIRGESGGMAGMNMAPEQASTSSAATRKRATAPSKKAMPAKLGKRAKTPAPKRPMAPMPGMPGMGKMPGMANP